MVPIGASLVGEATGGVELLPPKTRLGEYEIERVLGSGGMGTVYAAWHRVLQSPAAIKVLNLDVSHNAAMVDRFVREAQATSRITHPNIIRVWRGRACPPTSIAGRWMARRPCA
jgi:serine/threonine protein kinase